MNWNLVVSLSLNGLYIVLTTTLAHEIGHILVALIFGIPVKKLGLNCTGIYLQRERGLGWAEVSACLAGPAMNMTLALLFWNTIYWFALCNLVFSVVNLLPIKNSDGSHAMEAIDKMRDEK